MQMHTIIKCLEIPPRDWFVLDVVRAPSRGDWCALMVDVPPDELKQNLATIIERAQARHITVVLAGMEAPPNFGRDYLVSFHQVYPALAKQYHVAFLPFLLDGVAGNTELNQRDGIHPTAEGAHIVAKNVWTVLKPMLAGARS